MFQATMSDTGEYIVGGVDMLSGILSIVYGCDYGKVQEACESAESIGWPMIVETPAGEFGFVITRKRLKQ